MKLIEKDSGVIGAGKEIAYVDGKYYLLSESPAKVCVSEDLENWTEYQLNESYLKPAHISYGNGIFLITGGAGTTNNTYYYYSTDGVNWIPKVLNTGENFSMHSNTCKFINNRFVFTTGYKTSRSGQQISSTKQFYETTDGINVTRHDYTIEESKSTATMDIDYKNGMYVSVGELGSIFTSSNLSNWTRRTSGTTLKLVGITYGKGQFVITGDKGTILTSTNGINWTKQESGTDAYLIRSRYANGMYIACGYNGTILQSIDGVSWTDIDNGTAGVRYGLAYNNEDNVMIITAYRYNSTGTIPIYILNLSRELTADSDEDSSLFFFDKELNLLGIVDYFISLRWRRKYFEAGEFEIVLPVNDYMMQFIDTDVIVMRNNYTEAGIIETIEFSDNGANEEATISGRFLTSLLSRRIVKSKINFSGNTIEGMNTIVNAMTPLTTQWETETVTMSSPHIDFQVTYKNVYDYLCKLSEYSNIGIRIVPNIDSKVYMFEAWKGLDRTSGQTENEEYSFSDDNYNIEQGKLVKSEKTKANYIFVGGTGEEDNRVLVTVDAGKTGFDLYEVFSDQKSLSNKDLSDSVYRAKLKSIGEGKLSDGTFQLEVTALVQQDYKVKWDLGDVVNIKKEKWGVYTTYRIIEVEETIEDGKKTIYPTFGNPLSSAWDDE
ncbi:MAG: siphovirus ReqiPepy6 Gp37-like family protein [Clostridium sp.]|nr:siphovirus ReqiPepy6 Gp37-like family protein [Clostridium sp.]